MDNPLNSFLIEGRVVANPLVKETAKGTPLCTFSIASARHLNHSNEKEVSIFDIETWAALAEICGKELKKGREVRVVGRLKQDRWTGTDGKTRSLIKVVAEHVEFMPIQEKTA